MKIKLAEKIIEIEHLFPYIEEYCRDYIVSDSDVSDFSICVSEEDIECEREKSRNEDLAEGVKVREFSDDYLETLAAYRKIAEISPQFDTVLFHGSAVAVDGAGFLFTAKSGTGKSTHTRLWRERFGDRAVMVNDDKPLIKICEDGSAVVYGTPWDGKHRLGNNISVPLKALCILKRGETNEIAEITKQEAYPMLLQQVYRPRDPVSMKKTMELLERLNVKLTELKCNMSPEAAEVSYSFMKG